MASCAPEEMAQHTAMEPRPIQASESECAGHRDITTSTKPFKVDNSGPNMDLPVTEIKSNAFIGSSSAGTEDRTQPLQPILSPPSAEATLCYLTETQELSKLQAQPDLISDDAPTRTQHIEPLSNFLAEQKLEYDYDDVEGHRILRLRPTLSQWEDFPNVLGYARALGSESDGCFKVVIPGELNDPLPEKTAVDLPANAYKPKLIRKTAFWQVSTVPSVGTFASSEPGPDCTDTVEATLKKLKHLFRKSQNRQLRNVRYRVDVPAWTDEQRQEAGVPSRSPIYPLRGDKLDKTKAIIPGIHTPYVYESGPYFGATFQIHAEDFRLASLNHLYKGRKIWIVVPATAVDIAEKALGRGLGCSQFMRHRAEFFFPDKLEKLGIPYRIVDQRPGETIVILPDAYHEGFSTGYTIAEAKNYADPSWSTDSYKPCEAACKLRTAIPASLMKPIEDGEARLDLCAGYSVPPAAEQALPESQLPTQSAEEQPAWLPTLSDEALSGFTHAETTNHELAMQPTAEQVLVDNATATAPGEPQRTVEELPALATPPASEQDAQSTPQKSEQLIAVQPLLPSIPTTQPHPEAPAAEEVAAPPVGVPQAPKRDHGDLRGINTSHSLNDGTVDEPEAKRIRYDGTT